MARFSAAQRLSGPLGNEPRAALPGEISPQPLGPHLAAILQLRERHHVNKRSDPEGYQPAQSRIRPDSKMAKFFPTTAMLPLSKYRKGRDFERPSSTAEMKRPTYRPRWIATSATPVWPAAGPVCKEFRTGVYCVIQIEMHPAAGQQSSVNLGELQ